jgi:hypothetical protein
VVDLNNLGLIDEKINVDVNNLPKEYSPSEVLPQPGQYVFEIPQLSEAAYQPYQTNAGQRLKIVFKGADALKVLPSKQTIPYASINNLERAYGKEKKMVSDMAFLLKALKYTGKLANNMDYAKAVAAAAASGSSFKARLSWQTTCSPTKDIYAGGSVQFGIKGCGQRFEEVARIQRDGKQILCIPRAEDGFYKERFECVCENQALLKVFPVLNGFQPVA